MKLIRARKRWLILLLGLVLAGGGIVAFRAEPSFTPIRSSVQFLPADSGIPGTRASLFERYVPTTWGWLWRLRDRVRGPRATVLMDVHIIDCTDVSEPALPGFITKPALAGTNGLHGWILDGPAMIDLRHQLKQLGGREISHPRVNTAHTIQTSLFVGTTVPVSGLSFRAGQALDLLPLIQPDGMELWSVFSLTEEITNRTASTSEVQVTAAPTMASGTGIITNLAAAARWKLPEGTGFFMLGPDATNGARRIGVILSATVQRPKK